MSIHGSEVLSQIEKARSAVAAQASATSRKLDELRNQHAHATSQLQQAYLTITQARTGQPGAQRKALSEVDNWLAAQANVRQGEGEALARRLRVAREEASASGEHVRECAKTLNRAQEAWDGARRTMHDTLALNDADFRAAIARQDDAIRRSQAVDEHLDEMTATTERFASACNEDPLFAYCAKRKVGLVDCEGNFLTRPLDRLVARVAGYYKHRQMLIDAQADLQQWVRHQALLHAELNDARQQLEKRIDYSLRSETGSALAHALSSAKVEMEKANRRHAAAQVELGLLVSQEQEFKQERDARAVEMRARVLDAISQASNAELARAASETPSREDDTAASLAATLRPMLPALEGKIQQVQADLASVEEQGKRLSTLVSRFKGEGYDRRYSRFDYGFNAETLVSGVLLGQMSVGQAMGRCESAHRDVTPPPPPPSSSPSFGSGSSSGGFSSGGGFGGGGGFSTGGGF